MNKRTLVMLVSTMVLVLPVSSAALAQNVGVLPGDTGRPPANFGDGVPPANPSTYQPPKDFKEQPPPARGPGIELALVAAKAIVAECKQYPLGVAVVDSAGFPILVYIPDGSKRFHAYGAIRKGYSAVVFKAPTSQMGIKAQQDPAFAAKVRADPNLVAFGGGIPLKVGDEIIGAIGVGGAEPGGHDEECALKGLAAIKDQLK